MVTEILFHRFFFFGFLGDDSDLPHLFSGDPKNGPALVDVEVLGLVVGVGLVGGFVLDTVETGRL